MEIKMGSIMGKRSATIGKIEVKINDYITQGQTLLNIETGKGNRPFKSIFSGIITKICVEEGDMVKAGDVLFEYRIEKEISEALESIKEKKEIINLETDLVIIGAGPGGYTSAIYAAQQGLKVILIEKEYLGGTCLNCGCIPTKTFLQSANIYEEIKNSEIFGISIENIKYDIKEIIKRKEEICQENRNGISFLLENNKVKTIFGIASLENKNEVSVITKSDEKYKISTKNIILATGSKSYIPSWVDSSVCIDSKKALNNFEIPKSIIIVGAGVIGMEFAFMYSAYGSKVKILEYSDHILGNLDSQASDLIKKICNERTIKIETLSEVIKIIETEDKKALVMYKKENEEKFITADKVLVSIGRIPQFDVENMKKIGILYNKKGIETDNNYETNIKNIYAIGDVNGKSQLAHSAFFQGMKVVDKILGKKSNSNLIIPSVIFTSPEIASVGINEKECELKKLNFEVKKIPFVINGKAKIENQTNGFIKLIKDKTNNQIIGGTIIGIDASSLISVLTLAITNKLTDKDIIKTVFSHPTTSEVIWEVAKSFDKGAIHYYE